MTHDTDTPDDFRTAREIRDGEGGEAAWAEAVLSVHQEAQRRARSDQDPEGSA
jgi:hypothetical protein